MERYFGNKAILSGAARHLRDKVIPSGAGDPMSGAGTPAGIEATTLPGGVGTPAAVAKKFGKEELERGRRLYRRAQEGKQNHDRRVTEGEEWYRMRYQPEDQATGRVPGGDGGNEAKTAFRSKSGWLFNNIANKHADAMDNYPRPNLLPREAGDQKEADDLTVIIPALLQQIHFEEVYSTVQYDKLKTGTGVYGVFWNGQAEGGVGEVDIQAVDVLSICWDPGVRNIQDSRNVFLTTLYDREEIEERYPALAGQLGGGYEATSGRDYIHDDHVRKEDKVAVIDWYYKKWQGERQVVHLCKFCGSEVLFSSEEGELAEAGLYEHGMFPFVLDVLYPIKDSPAGFGMVDICRNPQEYIDKLDAAILENAMVGATPRYFVPDDAGVNTEDLADLNQKMVKYRYSSAGSGIVPIQSTPLDSNCVSVLQQKVAELKEISGNRDVTQGGTTSGVTAASAIAALVETGSKLSRDASRGSYRAYRQVIELVVEIIRQFYTLPHKFRITGEGGEADFRSYTNQGLRPTVGVDEMTGQPYERCALFDIEITAERSSSYTRLSQNELMLQLYGQGFFNPGNADASMAAIEGMAFDQRDQVRGRIAAGQTLYAINQQLMATNAALAAATGNGEAMAAVGQQNAQAAATMSQVGGGSGHSSALTGESEPAHMTAVKRQVAEATVPA